MRILPDSGQGMAIGRFFCKRSQSMAVKKAAKKAAKKAVKKAVKKAAKPPQAASQEAFDLPLNRAKIHPAHEGVPDIMEEDFSAVLESVRQQGVQVPVEVLSPEDAEARGQKKHAGSVVDGRQRIRAAEKCGLKSVPAVYAKIPEAMDTEEYILRKSVERRHLTKGQRAVIAAGIKRKIEKGQGFRSDLLPEKMPEDGAKDARDRAGEMVGVSGRYVTAAEKLVEEGGELAKQVLAGEMNLMEAIRIHHQQTGAAETPKAAAVAMTTFKRFSSSFAKVRKPRGEKGAAYDAVKALLAELQEKLEALAE